METLRKKKIKNRKNTEGERGSFAGNFSLSLTAKEEFVGRIVSSFWTSYRIGWLPAPKAFKYSDDRAFYVDIYHPNPITKRQQRGRRQGRRVLLWREGIWCRQQRWAKLWGKSSHSTVHLMHLVGMQGRLSDLSPTPAKSGLPALTFMLTTKSLQRKQSRWGIFCLQKLLQKSVALIAFPGVVSPTSVTTGQYIYTVFLKQGSYVWNTKYVKS